MMMLTRNNRRGRSRGAAYAEALIMLPVFFITLWGYQLLFHGHSAKAEAAAVSRTSAWETSMAGCGLLDESDSTCSGCPAADTSDVIGALGGEAMGWFSGILGGLFGPMVGAGAVEDYNSGEGFSSLSRDGSVSASMGVVCNTKRETLISIIKQALCENPIMGPIVSYISDFC